MVLSDRDIRAAIADGRIAIDPLGEEAIQPASVDLRLGGNFRVFAQHQEGFIDVKQEMPHLTEVVSISDSKPFFLHPGEFALAVTLEHVAIGDDLVGRLDGKSSLGRLGLVIHSTAGFVDPGWRGHLTLELSNLSPLPITLYYGMKISQISFMQLTSQAEHPYGRGVIGSKYQDQEGPTPSRYYLNYPHRSKSRRTSRRQT